MPESAPPAEEGSSVVDADIDADENENGAPRRSWPSRVLGRHPARRIGAVLVVLALLVCGYGLTMWRRIDRFDLQRVGSPAGGRTYLLLGSDSREFVKTADDRLRYGGPDQTPGERVDVILALRVEENGARRLLVIPRDLVVVDRSGGPIRLAETLTGGPQAVVDTLCRSIGLGVDHALVMHLGGLRAMVNAIGGIDLHLDTAVRDRDSGLHLAGGNVHLDGNDVLAYVGSRHLEERQPDGTWTESATTGPDRPGRATELLQRIGAHLRPSPFAPLTAHRIAWAATGDLGMDASMGIGDVSGLRTAFGAIDPASRRYLPVTVTGSALPVDQLAPTAGAMLGEFEGSASPAKHCGTPAFPAANRGVAR